MSGFKSCNRDFRDTVRSTNVGTCDSEGEFYETTDMGWIDDGSDTDSLMGLIALNYRV